MIYIYRFHKNIYSSILKKNKEENNIFSNITSKSSKLEYIVYELKDFINLTSLKSNKLVTTLILVFSLLIKLLISNYGYSGKNNPPKYGDFEAQRHWMEVTVNLHIKDWYNNIDIYNPMSYWPIDYPPLSAYFAYFWGKIFEILSPNSIELINSRGEESYSTVKLMRATVIISDLLFFTLPVIILVNYIFLKLNKDSKHLSQINLIKIYICLILVLFSPSLLIIDHGHFQYNCVMLGLFVISLIFLINNNFEASIIFITMAINFKITALYYAFPYLIYCLYYTYKNYSLYKGMLKLFKYSIVFILTIIIIWMPWIYYNNYNSVINRIFPLWRGVFEDKVASFWCTFNIFKKINTFKQNYLLFLSTSLTLIFCFPSLLIFKLDINSKEFKYYRNKMIIISIFTCSMSFFMFSFHVHEKTIMLPVLAFCLCFDQLIELLPSFTMLSIFSLYPMLSREGLELPYICLLITSFIFTKKISSNYYKLDKLICHQKKKIFSKGDCLLPSLFNILDYLNLIIIFTYHYYEINVKPPQRYPYLYPAINSAYCFLWFFITYLSSVVKMICITNFET